MSFCGCCLTLPKTIPHEQGVENISPTLCFKWLQRVGKNANYEYSILRPEAMPQPPKLRKRDRDRAGATPCRRSETVIEGTRGPACPRTGCGANPRSHGHWRPRYYLAQICDEGLLIKVGYGLYCAAEPVGDEPSAGAIA